MSAAVNLPNESRDTVAAKLNSAIETFMRDDLALLNIDVSERTVTQRLAVYMQKQFSEWHVDCEYNRLLNEVKKLRLRAGVVRVVPDIIVHRRNSDNNLLVIEAKKDDDPRGESGDIERLHAFKDQLGYSHAILLRLFTGDNPRIEVGEWI